MRSDERQFVVTVSRIPTSDMLYARRSLANGEEKLYVVMTSALSDVDARDRALKVGAALIVSVAPDAPDSVLRAQLDRAASSAAVPALTMTQTARASAVRH